MTTKARTGLIPVRDALPPPRQRVFVACAKFRCRGYIDENGIWRHDSDGKEIENVIGWTEFPTVPSSCFAAEG
ncbi:MAG TPA: hypothetical protein VNU68_21680 [Verrucomicrobiae bacterium]|jgi:hypothetical protein|nr:hypothetical protein [Verrucomicrobiae bacterium]